MSLQDLLLQAQPAIVARWFQRVLDSYPADTARYLEHEPDRFQNPVGQTIRPALESLYVALVKGEAADAIRVPLDDIIRIRAVQDFRAAAAVGFLFQLKPLIREQLQGTVQANGGMPEVDALEERIDTAILLAFDIYMECREQVYSIRTNSIKRRTELLMERTQRKGGGDR